MLVETKSHVLLWFGLVITKSKIGPVKWLPVHLGCPFDWKLKEQMHKVAVAFVFPIFFAVSGFSGRRAVSSLYLSLFPSHATLQCLAQQRSRPLSLGSVHDVNCVLGPPCVPTASGASLSFMNCHMVHQASEHSKNPCTVCCCQEPQ